MASPDLRLLGREILAAYERGVRDARARMQILRLAARGVKPPR